LAGNGNAMTVRVMGLSGGAGVVCSDDDLRAIVHEHQLRWSPVQSTSACSRDRRSSRASSLDTAGAAAVFSSSAESLSQSPVLAGRPPPLTARQQSMHSDQTAVLQQLLPSLPAGSSSPSDTHRQVALLLHDRHDCLCFYH